MATYVIGDLHGCFNELQALLTSFQFCSQDTLWFTGDLVSGGSYSLETLRFIKSLGDRAVSVLGNHDMSLLAAAFDDRFPANKITEGFAEILSAHDKVELLQWLKHRPLLHYDNKLNILMTHAGISPLWDINRAIELAKEVEQVMQEEQNESLYYHMFGNEPNRWCDQLTGWPRWRCVINYLTRMRFVYADGSLNFTEKGKMTDAPATLVPWFTLPFVQSLGVTIIFGHWAALAGVTNQENVIAMDTGCVWGNKLTALRLDDHCYFSVPCPIV